MSKQLKRKNTYIIDTENVQHQWINWLPSVQEGDEVFVLAPPHRDSLDFTAIDQLLQCKGKVYIDMVQTGMANALDFQLSSLVGCLVATDPTRRYIIVARDHGYAPLQAYWKAKGASVHICERIGDVQESIFTTNGRIKARMTYDDTYTSIDQTGANRRLFGGAQTLEEYVKNCLQQERENFTRAVTVQETTVENLTRSIINEGPASVSVEKAEKPVEVKAATEAMEEVEAPREAKWPKGVTSDQEVESVGIEHVVATSVGKAVEKALQKEEAKAEAVEAKAEPPAKKTQALEVEKLSSVVSKQLGKALDEPESALLDGIEKLNRNLATIIAKQIVGELSYPSIVPKDAYIDHFYVVFESEKGSNYDHNKIKALAATGRAKFTVKSITDIFNYTLAEFTSNRILVATGQKRFPDGELLLPEYGYVLMEGLEEPKNMIHFDDDSEVIKTDHEVVITRDAEEDQKSLNNFMAVLEDVKNRTNLKAPVKTPSTARTEHEMLSRGLDNQVVTATGKVLQGGESYEIGPNMTFVPEFEIEEPEDDWMDYGSASSNGTVYKDGKHVVEKTNTTTVTGASIIKELLKAGDSKSFDKLIGDLKAYCVERDNVKFDKNCKLLKQRFLNQNIVSNKSYLNTAVETASLLVMYSVNIEQAVKLMNKNINMKRSYYRASHASRLVQKAFTELSRNFEKAA